MLNNCCADLQDRSTIYIQIVISLFQYCLERNVNLVIILIVELKSLARNY